MNSIIFMFRKEVIKMEFDAERHRFFIEENGEFIGEIKFTPINNSKVISTDHTFVKESHRGKGLARQFVQTVIDYAKENNLKILPICPYAKKVFNQEPDIRDILEEKYLNNLILREKQNGSK
ncbi:GNAT family N-acetyltransferase [Companilactobacillus sp. DQM5]|uniref:GNAT family N-acetyltransferase n=1 Tax=Companilactobacillus sp. DQM5 TaxID=3463359 RepID=UPI0040588DDA